MFANADSPLRIYSFLVQLPISPLATPIFPTKVATVEALQSSANAVAIVDTPICNCSIVSFFQNILTLERADHLAWGKKKHTTVEYSARAYDCSLKTLNLHLSDLLTEVRRAPVRSLHYPRPSPLSWNK